MVRRGTKNWTKPALLALLILLPAGVCFAAAAAPLQRVAAEQPAATATAATPSPSATAKPTPTPTPTATPTPTPSPEPTPTPHPWESHFVRQGTYVHVESPDDGPWDYKDQTLSVHIEKKTGKRKQVYFVAEVYTRGPLPFGGFANKNPKARSKVLPYRIARQYQAVLGITGDYLTYRDNEKGVMIRNGTLFYDRKQADTLAVMPDGELKICLRGEVAGKELLAAGVKDSFAFGPVIVQDGKVNPKLRKAKNHYMNYRSTIGMVEKGHYFFIVTEGRFEYEELAQIYIDLGCSLAYNLDGGNSAAMVFMGEQLNLHVHNPDLKLGQRPLPDLLMIGCCPDVPGEKEPVYNNGERKSKKYRPK